MTATVSMARRIAAAFALACTLAVVVFVAVALWRNGVRLVFGLAGLALTVAGAWWFAAERMPRRAFGAAAGVVGVLLLLGAVALTAAHGERAVLKLVVIAICMGAGLGSGRAAIAKGIHRLEPSARPAGPPRHPVLFLNPKSGGGKVEEFGLVDLARELGVETVMLEGGRDLEQLARDAVARGADCLGMAGGDGSQALVASIAVEHD